LEQSILEFISNVYQHIQWPGVILFMAIESACIPLPSEIIMPLAGWMLIKDPGLPVSYVFLYGLFGAVGNVIGSIVAYEVGKWGGRPLLERWGKYVLITRHDLDRADYWFNRYGSISIFVSRLLPAVRTFISLPAGIAKMNRFKFISLSFIGSFIWSVALAWAGYLIGQNWETIRNAMRPFDWVIVAICLLLIAYYIYRHIRHFRQDKNQTRETET
jgi:membrane protein DedA with SNARE-associated domain